MYADKEQLMEKALSMATEIAEKSPVAIAGTKENLNYSRDHSVPEGLDHMVSCTDLPQELYFAPSLLHCCQPPKTHRGFFNLYHSSQLKYNLQLRTLP